MKKAKKKTRKIKISKNKLAISSIVGLSILLALLLSIGYYLNSRPKETSQIETKVKKVEVYRIGQAPSIEVLGKVEKENVITIVAQKPGVVQKIYVEEGEHVPSRGKTLMFISDNYAGANTSSLSRQIAQKQFENTKDTFDIQKDLINKQKELASKVDENSDELREISSDSVQETKDLIGLNEEILSYIDHNIELYESSNSANANRDAIAASKQLKSSFLSATTQLRSSLRNLEYSSAGDNPQAQISNLNRETTIKSLEIQEKALQLSLEISDLQYKLAKVSESLAYPSSFSNGNIEKIHVRPGQAVGVGTPLITMSGCDKAATVTAYVSQDLAKNVSIYNSSKLRIGGSEIELTPEFISGEAVDGLRYAVKFSLPESYYDQVTDLEYIPLSLSLGFPDSSGVLPYIPLDSVYQSKNSDYVFVIEDDIAKSRKIILGEVQGQLVSVVDGLDDDQIVVTDRTVIDGEKVEESK